MLGWEGRYSEQLVRSCKQLRHTALGAAWAACGQAYLPSLSTAARQDVSAFYVRPECRCQLIWGGPPCH